MPDNNQSNKGSSASSTILKTVVGVGIGALVAAGAYFVGKMDGQEEAQHSYQQRVNIAQNMTPKTTVNSEKSEEDEKLARECDICMRSFRKLMEAGEEIHTTPCGHVFCKECIATALASRPECPICKGTVHADQTLRIYL